MHHLKLTCRLIDRYPEIGDDDVTLTDNDAAGGPSQWFLNYMLLLLMMNINSVDTSVSSGLFLWTTLRTCRSALLFYHIHSSSASYDNCLWGQFFLLLDFVQRPALPLSLLLYF